MNDAPRYRESPWPVLRNITVSALDHQRPHTAYGFAEVNINDALAAINRCRRLLRMAVPLHAYVIYCLARAAAEHPAVHTYKHRGKLITFEDVDVGTMIEKRLPNQTRLPVGCIFRAANRKSLAEINWEFRQASKRDLSDDPAVRFRRRAARLPGFLRGMIFRHVINNPFRLRRVYGTIGLTNLQTPMVQQPFFGLPPNLCTMTMAIGSITERFVPDETGRPVLRKMLCLSSAIDHDLVDGMSMVRFCGRFIELVESAAGLNDDFVAQTRALQAASAP
jgi:pyruvate/2-oxoglutarate dehydrogenase complex dihydrolipoamide acyltransferase (E2) component